ncbi:DUF4476 domain-containing protein [Colwelliaceae bacterium 6441]
MYKSNISIILLSLILMSCKITTDTRPDVNVVNNQEEKSISDFEYLATKLDFIELDSNKIEFLISQKDNFSNSFSYDGLSVLVSKLTHDSSKLELVEELSSLLEKPTKLEMENLLKQFSFSSTKAEVLKVI